MLIRIRVWNDVSQSAQPGSRVGLSLKILVFVTKPHLLAFDGYVSALDQVWQRKRMTYGGPLHERLERWIPGCPGLRMFAFSLMVRLR